jgi:hypothetical protein
MVEKMRTVLQPKINLTPREQQHQIRGHYHFDPSQGGSDTIVYPVRFPKLACDDVSRLVVSEHARRGHDPSDPLFVWMDVGRHTQRTNSYSDRDQDRRQRDQEIEQVDRAEQRSAWDHSGMDTSRAAAITVTVKDWPELNDMVEHYIQRYNWMGQRPSTGHKIWLQYPGQMTYCHIDHIYAFYNDRQDMYENPGRRRKAVSQLTQWEPGNYFCWGNTMMGSWNQGDTFTWTWGMPHWTANLGRNPRVSINWLSAEWYTDQQFLQGWGETI